VVHVVAPGDSIDFERLVALARAHAGADLTILATRLPTLDVEQQRWLCGEGARIRLRRIPAAANVTSMGRSAFAMVLPLELAVEREPGMIRVSILRCGLDRDACLAQPTLAAHGEALARPLAWRDFLVSWSIDWHHDGCTFVGEWHEFRVTEPRKSRPPLACGAERAQFEGGDRMIAVRVADVFGNEGFIAARLAHAHRSEG
jgi:hypothetical protein